MKIQTLTGTWQFRQLGTQEWLPATVPGGAHTDLIAAGRIPDPFDADNELRVQWVADADWTYRRFFTAGSDLMAYERVELVCDGLDTLAEVKINGQLVGQANNAFRQYRWEVKGLLTPGQNELEITFSSATRYCAARHEEFPLRMANDALPGAPYLRKAPCHFGWDWGPKLPPVGIWRDIFLEGHTTACLEDVHIRQRHADGGVTVSVDVAANTWAAAPLAAIAYLTAPDGTVSQANASLDAGLGRLEIIVGSPQLWWPNGCGPQPLYQLAVTLSSGGLELEKRSFQLGLRTIELRQQQDEWGRSFTFVVNGVPVFAKGSDWIPSDSFPTRLTPAALEHLVRSAALANHNMIRVWGGGYYEDEVFYDLCDRFGILVWQDFMFACSIYPLNQPQFVENVHSEVIYNVRRLRHRACLALWCGNNEMESGWMEWGWTRPDTADLKAADKKFFYKTLPAWVDQEDPDRPYWPSSPSSGLPHEIPDSPSIGDRHLWEVWHQNKPLHFYREQFPRFASEFGFQSLPALRTVATYAGPEDWNMTSYIMEHHQRNRAGNEKIIAYLTDHYRLPKDFPALVYITQVLQAEAIRIAVEHWRRTWPRCSGTLYWQLNDCWPVASWASVDYFGRWKALHYASRRFYRNLLLSIKDEATSMGVFVSNDTSEPWRGEVRWSLETLAGAVLAAGTQEVSAGPQATTPVLSLDFAGRVSPESSRSCVIVAELWQAGSRLALQVASFVPDKHLELADPQVKVSLELAGEQLVIHLKAASLARFVELALDGADVIFSDNFFDLPAGRDMRVTCPLPEGWDQMQAQNALHIRNLKDSY